MLPEWTVVGFSGHRKLADPKVAATGIHNALERLAANHSPLASVSSAASGALSVSMCVHPWLNCVFQVEVKGKGEYAGHQCSMSPPSGLKTWI